MADACRQEWPFLARGARSDVGAASDCSEDSGGDCRITEHRHDGGRHMYLNPLTEVNSWKTMNSSDAFSLGLVVIMNHDVSLPYNRQPDDALKHVTFIS